MKKLRPVLIVVLLVLLAGCVGVGDGGFEDRSGDDIESPTESDSADVADVDSPWGKKTISVAVSDEASGELHDATTEAVEFWNDHQGEYSTYEYQLEEVDDTDGSDIVVQPESYPMACDIHVATDTVGCAPILDADMSVSGPVEVSVLEHMPQPAARQTVKHELGHVLGLTHDDEPQPLMSHDPNLTAHQQSVVDEADPQELEQDIESGINDHRTEHGLDELRSDEELRDKARERAKEVANDDRDGFVVYTDHGMELDCEIELDGLLYLSNGDGDIYATSLYRFHGIGGATNFSDADYTAGPEDASQQAVSEWQFNESDPRRAEHYSRHGVGVHITESGDYATVRAIC